MASWASACSIESGPIPEFLHPESTHAPILLAAAWLSKMHTGKELHENLSDSCDAGHTDLKICEPDTLILGPCGLAITLTTTTLVREKDAGSNCNGVEWDESHGSVVSKDNRRSAH
jgi:hypothetical protein